MQIDIPLRVLLVEDSENDALLIIDELRDGGYDPVFERVETRDALEAALISQVWDIVIADYRLPSFSGIEAMEMVCKGSIDCPFIIVSGLISEETAVKAMRGGAKDYVLKSNLARLVPAIEREMHESEVRRQRMAAEEALHVERERTSNILESIKDAFFAVSRDWLFTYINSEGANILGKDWRFLKGKNARDEFTDAIFSPLKMELEKSMAAQVSSTCDFFHEPTQKWFSVRVYPSSDGISIYFRDITDQKLAEEELARSRSLLEHALERERHFSLLLQRALLPTAPEIGPGYNVAAVYVPMFSSREIGGDFYDVFQVEEGRAGVLIGDVSGKGLEAAAMAATTRSTIHAFIHETDSAAKALARANSVLYSRKNELDAFATVFLVSIDLCTGEINYSSAGHPPILICRADGSVEFLKYGQLPLGIRESQDFAQYSTQLNPGDKIVLYTDGISEARHSHEFFDMEGIERSLLENAHLPAEGIAQALLTAATNWANGKLTDDAAVVVVERT